MKKHYPVLEAEISKSGVKKQDIAKTLGITPRCFSKKMQGQVDFWLSEAIIIHSLFPEIPIEKLFEIERSTM